MACAFGVGLWMAIMEKKFYYDCPIEAAYMAKNFDIKFEIIAKDKDTGELMHHPIEGVDNLTTAFKHVRVTICPDSIKLLAPKKGDILLWKYIIGNDDSLVISQPGYWDEASFKPSLFDESDFLILSDNRIKNITILARGDKSFIMPKEEICEKN